MRATRARLCTSGARSCPASSLRTLSRCVRCRAVCVRAPEGALHHVEAVLAVCVYACVCVCVCARALECTGCRGRAPQSSRDGAHGNLHAARCARRRAARPDAVGAALLFVIPDRRAAAAPAGGARGGRAPVWCGPACAAAPVQGAAALPRDGNGVPRRRCISRPRGAPQRACGACVCACVCVRVCATTQVKHYCVHVRAHSRPRWTHCSRRRRTHGCPAALLNSWRSARHHQVRRFKCVCVCSCVCVRVLCALLVQTDGVLRAMRSTYGARH
jgi:hypothetical protein